MNKVGFKSLLEKVVVIIVVIFTGTHMLTLFYFLKCGPETSFPIFHEPRTGARATKLKMKTGEAINAATELVHFKPKPGDLIIFQGI